MSTSSRSTCTVSRPAWWTMSQSRVDPVDPGPGRVNHIHDEGLASFLKAENAGLSSFTQAGLGSHPIFASLQILVKTTCFAHFHGMFKSYHSENPPCRKKPKKPPNLGKVSMSLNTSGFTLKFKALKKKFWWDTAKLLAEMNASHTVPKWCWSHPCKKI